MNHQLLLISSDAGLAERVRRALPATLALEMQCAPAYRPASDPRGWLLVLQDARAGRGPDPACAAPVLWIGSAWGDTGRPSGAVADYLERFLTPAKLAFILHQHLAAAYLGRMRRLAEEPAAGPGATRGDAGADPAEIQARLNNLLAGILGNAELARAAGRLQPAVARRLECIQELAAQMRPLLRALDTAAPAAPRPQFDAAA